MGNCMAGDVGGDVVRIMTDSGGIIELEGPIQVRTVVIDFPGYGIFRQGNVSTPLSGHDQLLNGRLYYLLPVDMMRIGSNAEVMEESDAGSETLTGSSRLSSGTASDLLTNLTVGPALEVLPSPGNGVWKVKLVINTDQLAEILSEQSNTQALIERMRTAASTSGATPKRDKGTWSVGWRAGVSSMCKLPAEGCV
ncbi:uncharacterized protein LOC131246894 [Magnolia sinica]|uniref:uncharacterized protein LOC131246894 n=1 Tax=Magnolia sinica TaxID=86752 RepID=UPI00265A3BD4|nr:uncharacterized protein LOC131246894 [Magnolia sinica]